MHTDEGIVGLGEPVVEGRSQTVAAAVHEIGRYLNGQDPTRIEHHCRLSSAAFYRGGPVLTSALSGIEHASGTSPASGWVSRYTSFWAAPCAIAFELRLA